MKTMARFCFLVVAAFTLVSAQSTRWRTTRGPANSGPCQLESNSISMTVHPFHVDIEEEATISARGFMSWGDSSTLEITGQFTLMPGSAVRSMLLWQGDKLLKAKLKDRTAADSAYEEVVDRQQMQVVARDPALIEYLGDNRYGFQIYPVALNGSRRIRILYSVPLSAIVDGPRFEITTAFTLGPQQGHPAQIPVEIKADKTIDGTYKLIHRSRKRTIQFGATYLIPYDDFAAYYTWYGWQGSSFSIQPDSVSAYRSYATNVPDGAAAGHYTAIFAAVPDSIRQQFDTQTFTEISISAGDKTYLAEAKQDGSFGIFLKSSQAWDGKVSWNVYDTNGDVAFHYNQLLAPDTALEANRYLPLLWGVKYSLEDAQGNLGGIYGFVDRTMSLLALEEDALPAQEAAEWEQHGVPELLPEEIVVDTSTLPVAPREYVIIEMDQATSVRLAAQDLLQNWHITVLPDGQIVLQFDRTVTGGIMASLYTVNGRLVTRWNDVRVQAGQAHLALPAGIHGTFVLRIARDGRSMQKKLTIH